MTYHDDMEKLKPTVTEFNAEHFNAMIKFAKTARRSAKQNKVLWRMVEQILPEGLKLQLETKERQDGETYEDWMVVPK
jgi:hypothetical protein